MREPQNGSYGSMSRKRGIMTSSQGKNGYPFVPTMGISALHSKNSIETPKTPIDTPKRKPMNIRESNWRQGQSNVQGASDILRKDAVDWRRVKLPPGQKTPPIYKFYSKISTSIHVNDSEQFLNQTNTNKELT